MTIYRSVGSNPLDSAGQSMKQETVVDLPPPREESGTPSPQRSFRRHRISNVEEAATLIRNTFTRLSSRRMRKRVVFKNGECNVTQANVAKRKRRYLADIFTTLVDIQWRWNLLVFAMGFILSWLVFALVWWLISFTHGDLEHASEAGWQPCVVNIDSFTSAFLFSIESQHTIGYGYRYITETCPEGIFTLCLQSIVGVMIQSFMVGVVFAKLSRPKKRTQTLMFSRNAVICQRDGRLCLMFRVGDMRKSHIVEAHLRAQLIKNKITMEGELLPYFQYEVQVGFETGEDRILFIWPVTIVHVINDRSPFYNMSAQDLLRERFELVVVLEGCIESTGMTTQARSSYLPGEILWGHKFEQLVSFKRETGEYQVDYSLFNTTSETDTPLCCARELLEYQRAHNQGTETPPEHKGAFGKSVLKQMMKSKDPYWSHGVEHRGKRETYNNNTMTATEVRFMAPTEEEAEL